MGLFEVKSYCGKMGITYRRPERITLSANDKYVKYDYKPLSDALEKDYMLGVTRRLIPTLTFTTSKGRSGYLQVRHQ